MKKEILGSIIVVTIIGIGTWFISNKLNETSVSVTSEASTAQIETAIREEVTESVKATPDENGLIIVSTDMYSFTPNVFEVEAGQTVTVQIKNIKGEHDFVIDELDVHTHHVTKPGDIEEVTFTIPEDASGNSYEYYCGVGNHRELGQIGMLIVK